MPETDFAIPPPILIEQLTLLPFTHEMIHDAQHDRTQLAARIGARVPGDWPQPDFAEILPLIETPTRENPQISGWTRLILLNNSAGAERTLIGAVGLTGAPDPNGCVAFGYDILPDYQRRGFATEAAAAFLRWVQTQPGIERIMAECEQSNPASIRVLQKLGLTCTGTMGSLLQWEWNGSDTGLKGTVR